MKSVTNMIAVRLKSFVCFDPQPNEFDTPAIPETESDMDYSISLINGLSLSTTALISSCVSMSP